MFRAMHFYIAGLVTVAIGAFAQAQSGDRSRADPNCGVMTAAAEVPVQDESAVTAEPQPLPADIAPAPLPNRCVVCNPPSRVIHGHLVRRIVPSKYAKPFNKGPYRYEPHLGDIRNVPPPRTLPGYYEGSKEILYSLPARDRGYFVLHLW